MGVRMFQPLRMDLGDVLEQSTAELKQAIARAKVLVIANQDVSVAPYVQLMRRLGSPVHHVLAKVLPRGLSGSADRDQSPSQRPGLGRA
ncbi:hypothetical protein [Pseudomonas syringae]|uniref:hypothetical protein n=1 Tax=Pseudomonas syringae TaxID=317 RepID=UPI000CD36BFF|nr:hypothetical protein [Pseudomonas syringae]SOS19465.1 hypothetical protein CFBP6109_03760 [Pseudomonas syringae pv. cerasicola]